MDQRKHENAINKGIPPTARRIVNRTQGGGKGATNLQNKMSNKTTKSRFYIANRFECPDERHIAEKRDDGLFYYVHPHLRDDKKYWEMNPSNPTPVEDFGISITIENGMIRGSLVSPSVVKYADDRPRKWQGSDEFEFDYQKRAKQ